MENSNKKKQKNLPKKKVLSIIIQELYFIIYYIISYFIVLDYIILCLKYTFVLVLSRRHPRQKVKEDLLFFVGKPFIKINQKNLVRWQKMMNNNNLSKKDCCF